MSGSGGKKIKSATQASTSFHYLLKVLDNLGLVGAMDVSWADYYEYAGRVIK